MIIDKLFIAYNLHNVAVIKSENLAHYFSRYVGNSEKCSTWSPYSILLYNNIVYYYIIRTNTKFARRSLSVCGPLIWSEVPHELKNLSFPKFKKNFKKHLIPKYDT